MSATRASVPVRVARAIEVSGAVRGIGFRPFVSRLAVRHGIGGWVRGNGAVIQIVAEGSPEAVEGFCADLSAHAPPPALVEAVSWTECDPVGVERFDVEPSALEDGRGRVVSPDVATCPACLSELFEPSDRRYRYAFTACADCGPRYSLLRDPPYVRERSSMGTFAMCERCAAEYQDPADRRFGDEVVSCPRCGPSVGLVDPTGTPLPGDAISEAAALLRGGAIVAVKGLRGFRLVCDATSEEALSELRRRSLRPDEPFPVMASTIDHLCGLFEITDAEADLLTSWRAPIVQVGSRGLVAPSVAPGYRRIGTMLPATALHHLLAVDAGIPLVMAPGNRAGTPPCPTNDDALDRLSRVAQAFLINDLEVAAPTEDSVARVWNDSPIILRWGRGFAPAPIRLAAEIEPTLGIGAGPHGAFCLAVGHEAFLSQHLQDIETREAMDIYEATLRRYRGLLEIEPSIVAHDPDPEAPLTRFALRSGLQTVAVQHHHAHIASVMAEHALDGPVIGVAFDDGGWGLDGTTWGGEFLVCAASKMERVGHLRPIRQPGGEAAVLEPTRMAIAFASEARVLKEARKLLPDERVPFDAVLEQMSSEGAPITTSARRLFDAVSALAGITQRVTYDGQSAHLLEQVADPSATFEYGFDVGVDPGGLVLDTRPIIAAVVRDLARGRSSAEVAGRFHRTMAAAVLSACRLIRGRTGLTQVCLGGDVFEDVLLVSDVAARLSTCDFEVFVPRQVPVGDQGIALGQVLVAHSRRVAGVEER